MVDMPGAQAQPNKPSNAARDTRRANVHVALWMLAAVSFLGMLTCLLLHATFAPRERALIAP
jgi:hypothetical protein